MTEQPSLLRKCLNYGSVKLHSAGPGGFELAAVEFAPQRWTLDLDHATDRGYNPIISVILYL